MKKLIALISGLFALTFAHTVNADVLLTVSSDALGVAVNSHFKTEDERLAVVSAVLERLKASPNGLSASDVWKVCAIGGLDIANASGRAQCESFLNNLFMFADTNYVHVCDTTKKSDIADVNIRNMSKCDKEFFKSTQVQVASGIVLAQEYARIKLNDTIICSSKFDKQGWADPDYYLACKSTKTGAYYDFMFDDLEESFDNVVSNNIKSSVCRIYDTTKYATAYEEGCKYSDCDKMSQTAKLLGFNLRKKSVAEGEICEFMFNAVGDASKLKKACGINNFVFQKGIQVKTSMSLNSYLREYVAAQCGVKMGDVVCSAAATGTYVGPEHTGTNDDILTCSVGDKQIDFVFDDINEAFKYVSDAGEQGVMCITNDGTFDGKNCVALDKQNCEVLQKVNTTNCPECKSVRWDAESNLCVLDSAKFATNMDKTQKIATVAGTVIVAVAATVLSGGTAAPGAWAVVAVAADGLVVLGGAAVIASEAVMTFGIWDPFVEKANKCIVDNDAACAERLVIDELNSMQSYSEDLGDREALALDEIFVKLIQMIPDDSRFWDDFYGNPEFFDCSTPNNPETCVVKESAQLFQIMRTAGNTAMIIGGFMKMMVGIGSKLVQTQNAVRARVVDNMHNKTNMLKVVNPGGSPGSLVANDFIKTLNIPGVTTNSGLVKHLGLKVGQTIWLTDAGTIITSASSGINMAGLIPITVGAGNQLYHSGRDADFVVMRSWAKGAEEPQDTTPVVTPNPEPNPTPVVTPKPEPKPEPTPVVTPKPEPKPEPTPVVTPKPEPKPGPTPVVTPKPEPKPGPTPVVTPNPEPVRVVTPHKTSSPKNAAVGAVAAVASVAAVGGLIGGLIVAGDKEDAKSTPSVKPVVPDELNSVMNTAVGPLGTVNNNEIRLIPMPTTDGTNAPIVNLDGRAVVVVDYRGNNLPYYLDGRTRSWAPLLGIGENGGWFNTYTNPERTGIATIDSIRVILNDKITPSVVLRHVTVTNSGVRFPMAAYGAYAIINKLFVNGVVQSNPGVLDPASSILYDSNYKLVYDLLK